MLLKASATVQLAGRAAYSSPHKLGDTCEVRVQRRELPNGKITAAGLHINTHLQLRFSSIFKMSSTSLLSSSFCSQFPNLSRPAASLRRSPMLVVRASADDSNPNAVVDRATKKEITKEDVLRNQEQNESEKRPFFGGKPAKGSLYPFPRDEIERRPETGDKSFGSLMAFDGAGPETINGRLAMVGIVWAFLAERATGLTVAQQLFAAGGSGLFNFLAVVQLLWYASLVPMFRGESPDSRQLGPFRAKAERWNGRTAMLGFLYLVVIEAVTRVPAFNPPMM